MIWRNARYLSAGSGAVSTPRRMRNRFSFTQESQKPRIKCRRVPAWRHNGAGVEGDGAVGADHDEPSGPGEIVLADFAFIGVESGGEGRLFDAHGSGNLFPP